MTQIDMTWNLLPLLKDEYHHLFAKHKDGRKFGMCIKTRRGLDRFVEWANEEKFDAYIGANPLHKTVAFRPRAHDVSRIRAIVFDIDPVAPKAAPRLFAHRLHSDLANDHQGMLESVVHVDSGRGVQLWVLMMAGKPELQPRAKQFVRRYAKQFGEDYGSIVDTACTDLPRVVRMPGTFNQKTGREATILSGAEPLMSEWWLECQPKPSAPERPVRPAESLEWILCTLPDLAVDYIQNGVELERHKACYTAMKSLHEVGVEADVALQLTLKGATMSSLDPAHVHYTFEQVYEDSHRSSTA